MQARLHFELGNTKIRPPVRFWPKRAFPAPEGRWARKDGMREMLQISAISGPLKEDFGLKGVLRRVSPRLDPPRRVPPRVDPPRFVPPRLAPLRLASRSVACGAGCNYPGR